MDELTPSPKVQSLLGLPLTQRGQVLLACPELVEGTLQPQLHSSLALATD